MSTSVLANVIVPLVLNLKGGASLILSIIPLETFVLWLLFSMVIKVKISIPRIFLVCAIANITSSLAGFFLPWWLGSEITWVIFLNWVVTIFVFGFIISASIEASIYQVAFADYPNILQNHKLLKASFLANLVSYACLFTVMTSTATSTLQAETTQNWLFRTRPSFAYGWVRSFSYNIMSYQKHFYQIHSQFAPTLKKLDKELGTFKNLQQNLLDDNQADGKFYKYEMSADISIYVLRSFPKQNNFSSFIDVVLVVDIDRDKPEFIQGRCRSDRPAIPPTGTPELINGKLQCPPNFSGTIIER